MVMVGRPALWAVDRVLVMDDEREMTILSLERARAALKHLTIHFGLGPYKFASRLNAVLSTVRSLELRGSGDLSAYQLELHVLEAHSVRVVKNLPQPRLALSLWSCDGFLPLMRPTLRILVLGTYFRPDMLLSILETLLSLEELSIARPVQRPAWSYYKPQRKWDGHLSLPKLQSVTIMNEGYEVLRWLPMGRVQTFRLSMGEESLGSICHKSIARCPALMEVEHLQLEMPKKYKVSSPGVMLQFDRFPVDVALPRFTQLTACICAMGAFGSVAKAGRIEQVTIRVSHDRHYWLGSYRLPKLERLEVVMHAGNAYKVQRLVASFDPRPAKLHIRAPVHMLVYYRSCELLYGVCETTYAEI